MAGNQGVAAAASDEQGGQSGIRSDQDSAWFRPSTVVDGSKRGRWCTWVSRLATSSSSRDSLSVYFAGDTAVFGDMRLIREMHAPEIAFLPIGDRFTMGPEGAALACDLLGVRQVVPMHYKTFPTLTGTPERLRKLVEPRGITVLDLRPGETAD